MEKSVTEGMQANRLISLDALRGFDMFWIIGGSAIVNGLAKALGGPMEALRVQFEHVPWEGLHFEDLIWPLFMFLVGVSIPLSVEKRKLAGAGNRDLLLHGLRRAVILFVLGMALQGGLFAWDISKLHPFYSVLHGIAAGYLIALCAAVLLQPLWQVGLIPVFLLLYWGMLELVPVPGFGAGVLTADGNAAIWIDRIVEGRFQFGENTWLLSYFGFASSVLLGVLAGRLMMSQHAGMKKVLLLAAAGVVCVLTGLLWSLVFPIIKLLWTGSFVLVGGGFSFLMLALFYWIIDVRGHRRGTFFFTVIGMNPIFAYVATSLINFTQIGNIFVGSLAPRIHPWGDFVSAIAAVMVLWLILYWMYRKKTFLKV
jgi:predicted acyltransferase